METKDRIDEGEYFFADTLKPADIKKPIVTTVKNVELITTMYGAKRVLVFDDGKGDKQVFLNALSLKELVGAYGQLIKDWIDRKVKITVIKNDKTHNKKSILVVPMKE